MKGTLLESNARREGPAGGALASLSLHALVLTLAVVVTARTRTSTVPEKPEILNWVTPPAPRAPVPAATSAVKPTPSRPIVQRLPLRLESPLDIIIKPIDALIPAPVAPAASSPAEPGSVIDGIASVTSSPVPDPGGVFDASQVERQVTLRSRAAPRYPAALQYAGVEGRVIAQFVVDERGKADVSTLKIIESAHELFSRSVRDVLPELRFVPAEVGGRRVSQMVQMPFDFRLNR